jgi:cell envelope opacity-associated protein A
MATWNQPMTHYERPAPTNRMRDFLVMAAFSLAALGAAFAFVQFKYADGPTKYLEPEAPASSMRAAATAPPAAPPTAAAREVESRALSELRADLELTRGDLTAAVARIDELETALQELQAAQLREPRPEPDAPAVSRAEPTVASSAEVAAYEAQGYGSRADTDAGAEEKEIAAGDGAAERYVVEGGDTLAKIASDHCLPLADLLRLNPDVRDPKALRVGQDLAVEDRCVDDPKGRAAAE